MRIGIVPELETRGGGVYQYSLTILHGLQEWKSEDQDEFVVFAHDVNDSALMSLKGRHWTIKTIDPPSPGLLAKNVRLFFWGIETVSLAWSWFRHWLRGESKLPDPDTIRFRQEMSHRFRDVGIELMIYPSPNPLSFETRIPYIMAIHDLQHRLQPQFPEVSANGEWERREYLFRNGTRHATLLIADSEVGKEDILTFYGQYGVARDRVKVLPYIVPPYFGVGILEGERERVRMTHHLPKRYLFYPAQFWPHKNHARIVQALGLLKQQHSIKVPVVFCGSYEEEIREHTFREVMSLSHQLQIEDQVNYLGYAPGKDMAGLYSGAVALVMPTFFGPTNIPVLEAWALGCPVLTSDIRGIREQVGDAAVLVDPLSVEGIAEGIYRLWTDENLRSTLADQGRKRLAIYTPDDHRKQLVEILEEGKERIRSEKRRSQK